MRLSLWIVTIAIALTAGLSTAKADTVVYTNFGPSFHQYKVGASWLVGSDNSSQDDEGLAVEFTPTQTYDFTGAVLALSHFSGALGPAAQVNVSLATSIGGLPGTNLETFSIFTGPFASLMTVRSLLNPLLEAGLPYWLVVTPANLTTEVDWGFSNSDFPSGTDSAFNTFGGPWTFQSASTDFFLRAAFEIDGTTSVPEGSTFMMLGFGLACLALCAKSYYLD